MASSFGSYEIARSGLTANERGLYVTGHNISNVNTPGYVRQQVIMSEKVGDSIYGKHGAYKLGAGTDIQQLRQVRNDFLDNIYRQENMDLGYWEARDKTLRDIQIILGEPMGEGLQSAMNDFYNSWQEVAKEPESLTVRALLLQKSQTLVHYINHMGEQIDRMQADINSEIHVRINEVNNITGEIAKLNLQILKHEIGREKANDYRDERNLLIDRLSKLINIDVNEMQDGWVDITTGGYFLVQKESHTRILMGEGGPGETFQNPVLEGYGVEVSLTSGTIKGLMESRGEVSGTLGSLENGTPNLKSHVTYIIDVSDSGGLDLDEIKTNIINDVQKIKDAGIDLNLTLISTYQNSIFSNKSYDEDTYADFLQDLNLTSQQPGDATESFSGVFDELSNIDFRDNENKYAVVFANDGVEWGEVSHVKVYDGNVASGTIGIEIQEDINKNVSCFEHTNNIIPDLRKQLNALINIMAREVNNIHRTGKTIGEPPADGQDFFTLINNNYPLEMGNLKINDNLFDLKNIVASAGEDRGDNTIALQIANIKNKPLIQDLTGKLSISDYYQSIILKVGYDGLDSGRITRNQRSLVRASDFDRQSISGVSMDEEMSNMMKYKYAYSASSRVINTLDEMLETIITRMGIAGR